MAITGIHSVTYRVEDLPRCTAFFENWGLTLDRSDAGYATFRLLDGSVVRLELATDSQPASQGVVETVWGVDRPQALDRLASDLARDRKVKRGDDGVFRFASDCGIAMGLAVFDRRPVLNVPDAVNAPSHVRRLNQWRKWRMRAAPKTMNHIVFGVDDYAASWAFFKQRLGFRLSDHSRGLGVFLRADGAPEHHNLFLQNCHYHRPSKPAFYHLCFGVEDIDELMAGANYMERLGHKSALGVGRHRIASALFYYIDCPAGGEIEYGADSDYLDDQWIPREWDPRFGYIQWCANLPPFMAAQPDPIVRLLKSEDDADIPDMAPYRLPARPVISTKAEDRG